MKRLLVLFALSLAANAAFLVTFFVRPVTGPGPADPASSAAAVHATAFRDASGTGLSSEDAGALKRSGELITGGDLRSLVARLRAAGFPPFIVRAIVTAQVTEQFGVRRKAVVAHQEVVPYWRSSQSFPHDPKAGAELAALSREQTTLLKELLGPDTAPTDEWARLIQQRKYGSLSQDKIDRLQGILSDYNDLRSQINAETNGVFLPSDHEKFQLLEREQRADLARLFTPEELEEYDLRNSNLANQLKFQLAGFNATEEEFRTLFRIHAAGDDNAINRGSVIAIGPANTASGNSRQAALLAQIEAAFGPERTAEYRQAMDPNYQQVNRLLARLELPSSLAPQVLSVQQDIQQRANAIRQDRTLSADARTGELTSLAQEAQAKLTSALGDRGYEAYKGFGGWWLNNLVPRPATPPKP